MARDQDGSDDNCECGTPLAVLVEPRPPATLMTTTTIKTTTTATTTTTTVSANTPAVVATATALATALDSGTLRDERPLAARLPFELKQASDATCAVFKCPPASTAFDTGQPVWTNVAISLQAARRGRLCVLATWPFRGLAQRSGRGAALRASVASDESHLGKSVRRRRWLRVTAKQRETRSRFPFEGKADTRWAGFAPRRASWTWTHDGRPRPLPTIDRSSERDLVAPRSDS